MSDVCRSLSKFVDRSFRSGYVSDTLSSASHSSSQRVKRKMEWRGKKQDERRRGEEDGGSVTRTLGVCSHCLTPPVHHHWAPWEGFSYSEQITCFRAFNDFWGWVLRFQQNHGNQKEYLEVCDCFLKSEGSVAWQRKTSGGLNESDHELILPYFSFFFSFPSIFGWLQQPFQLCN